MLTHLNTVRSVTIGGRLSRHIQRPASHPAHPRSSSSNATRSHANTRFAEKRHTAALRMSCDDTLSMRDVQTVLGHAHLSTTGDVYLVEDEAQVVRRVQRHLDERQRRAHQPPRVAAGYDADALTILFGGIR